MLFRVNTSLNKFYVFGLALLFTVALAGCGGGGTKKKAMDTDTGTPPATGDTPAEHVRGGWRYGLKTTDRAPRPPISRKKLRMRRKLPG